MPPPWRTPTSPRPWQRAGAWPIRWGSRWLSPRWPPTRTPSRSPGSSPTQHSLRTVSDLAALSQTSPVVLGGPPECPTRPFCQPGLEEVYGAQIKEFVPLDAGGPLTKQALAQGAIDVGLVFSSDGGVSALDLVVLEDDKALQTVDNLVPALSERASTPQNVAALNRLAATLTTEDLIELNRQVDIERRAPQEVAAEYLLAKGLVAAAP